MDDMQQMVDFFRFLIAVTIMVAYIYVSKMPHDG